MIKQSYQPLCPGDTLTEGDEYLNLFKQWVPVEYIDGSAIGARDRTSYRRPVFHEVQEGPVAAAQSTPEPSWRPVGDDEVIQAGDQVGPWGGWKDVRDSIGQTPKQRRPAGSVIEWRTKRPPVQPAAEATADGSGWRDVELDEILLKGDEVFCGGAWKQACI